MPLRLLSLSFLMVLTGCGYIKSLFPDKEKEYQYTQEYPALVIPADLKNDRLPSITKSVASPVVENSSLPIEAPSGTNETTKSATNSVASSELTDTAHQAEESVVQSDNVLRKREPIIVESIKTAEQSILRLQAPFLVAWRAVDKALGRKSIEISRRNEEKKQFSIRYEPAQGTAETSIWHELGTFFSHSDEKEQAYIIQLAEMDNHTDIMVLDEQQKSVSDKESSDLLNLLQQSIKADVAK